MQVFLILTLTVFLGVTAGARVASDSPSHGISVWKNLTSKSLASRETADSTRPSGHQQLQLGFVPPYVVQASVLQLPLSYAFEWQQEQFSDCSVTCGEGEEVSEVTCRDYKTRRRVRDFYCQETKKPDRIVRPCRLEKCQALWVTGEWGECSVVCGGGTSKRTVYCAEELHHGTYQRTLDRMCHARKPDAERPCNADQCPQWYAGQWSKCSVSCGSGIQSRAIVCRRTEQLDCIDDMKPIGQRSCHQKPCPKSNGGSDGWRRRPGVGGGREGEELSSAINGRDSTDPREAINVYNYRLNNFRGRQSAAGYGRIGVVIIDDPNREYVTERDYVTERNRDITAMRRPPKEDVTLPSSTTSSATKDDDGSGEGVESVAMVTNPWHGFREFEFGGSGEGIEDLEQRGFAVDFTDSEQELDQYTVTQLERRNELNLMTARRHLDVNLLPGTHLRVYCRSSRGHSSSVWMKNGEAVSKATLLLSSVRQEDGGTYSCMRGNQLSKVTIRLMTPEEMNWKKMARLNDTSVDPKRSGKEPIGSGNSEAGATGFGFLVNRIIAPNSATVERAPLSYIIASNWSPCECGVTGSRQGHEEGVQTRRVTCELVTDTFAVDVGQSFCSKRKLQSPATRKDCSSQCYSWVVGEWKQCSGESCILHGIGTRRRSVECRRANGIQVDETKCKANAMLRPSSYEPCHYEQCQAAWMPSPWSKCSVSCGQKGVMSRQVKCVWATEVSSPSAAAAARTTTAGLDDILCSNASKPTTHRLCFNPPCSSIYCRDASIYCSNVPLFGLCHLPKYSDKCCYSCSKTKLRQKKY